MDRKDVIEKKQWEKPKLLVLVKGEPEEAVLNICKTILNGGPALADCLTVACRSALNS